MNLISEALTLHQQGDLAEAEQLYLSILKSEPLNADAIHLIGLIAYQRKEYIKAKELMLKAINIQNEPGYLSNLTLVCLELKEYEEALEFSSNAIQIKPDFAEAFHNKSLVLMKLEKYQEVINNELNAIKLNPNLLQAYNNLGIAYSKINDYKKSIKNYDIVLNLDSKNIDALSNIAVIYLKQKKYEKAIEKFNQIIKINPSIAEVYSNISIMYYELRNYNEALNAAERALELNSELAEAQCNKAKILVKLNKPSEAIKYFKNALKINPIYPKIRGNIIHIEMQICEFINFEIAKKDLINRIEEKEKVVASFAALAFLENPELELKNARIQSNSLFINKKNNIKKLKNKNKKIGYFSSDFKSHPVTYLIIGLLENHNKEEYEIFCFSYSNEKDSYTNRVIDNCTKFIDINGISDENVKSLCDELELDIAVDLNGWTEDARTSIFAMRIAPIQINMLGYPGTMGNDAYDYIVADKYLINKDNKKYFSEKILYLKNFQPSDYKRPKREYTANEVAEKKFVFGVYNNSYKITPQIFDAWMKILLNNNNSIIIFISSSIEMENNIRCYSKTYNISDTRIKFKPRMNYLEYLSSYVDIDLFLDTYPFNAGTTANDSLWMDVPILTISGQSFCSRMAGSLLNTLGMKDLICKNIAEYIQKATELSLNKNIYTETLQRLKNRTNNTILFDNVAYARNIELAYSKIVSLLEDKKAFSDIDVS